MRFGQRIPRWGRAIVTVSLAVGSVALVAPGGAAASDAPSALTPVQPCRLLDTRDQTDDDAPAPAGVRSLIPVQVTSRCGIPDDVAAVALQITVTETEGAGHVTASPGGIPQPATSTVNWYRPHQTATAATIVEVGNGGIVDLHRNGPTHLIVDVNAYFTTTIEARSGRFVPIGPLRLSDSRDAGGTPWGAGESRTVGLPNGVPPDAVALAVNVTTVDSPAGGHFTAALPGSERPVASMLNTDGPGQTRASTTIVPVGRAGFDLYSSAGGHVVIDVSGYFTGPSAASSSDGLFHSVGPSRVWDTRTMGSVLFDGGSQLVDTSPTTGVVAAVVGTVTLAETSASTHLTVFPAGTALPATSNVNSSGAGQTVANLLVSPVSQTGLVIRTHRATHAIVDVTGFFLGAATPASADPYPISNVDPGPSCHGTLDRVAIVDRIAQRMWLCEAGRAVTGEMPFTAGPINDAPRGEYRVFFKRDPWWGAGYTLRWFTAFTRGDQGGRVAFHKYVAMREVDVGTERYRNASHGCFRLRTADALTVWRFLGWGDRVIILNNG